MTESSVAIPAGDATLAGDLEVPPDAAGVIAFAHGSGSGRLSPRNRAVAEALRDRGLGTLLMDLLTEEEERIDVRTGELRFDISLLATRMVAAVDWVIRREGDVPMGLFGASTGAAAALIAAAERPGAVRVVVSRGGRPDLAGRALPRVKAPTLLIVGGADNDVIGLNRQAMAEMAAEVHVEVVLGATHLFEEPGALEEVSRLAADWFLSHLPR